MQIQELENNVVQVDNIMNLNGAIMRGIIRKCRQFNSLAENISLKCRPKLTDDLMKSGVPR